MCQVIFTADDFGFDTAVNEAVERGCRDGILTCASLMVGGPAADDAVRRAKELPNLRVGLHLVLVQGTPILRPDRIPALVGTNGRFHDDLVAAGVRWFFLPDARRQLEQEIRAQFLAFRATGLTLDHVNGHNHMHIHPTVLGILLRLGEEFGVRSVRLPSEPLRLAGRTPGIGDRLAHAGLWPWLRLMRRRLRAHGLRHNDSLFGVRATGRMSEAVLLSQIAQLPKGISEFYFHPATSSNLAIAGAMTGYDVTGELDALVSPRVAQALREAGIAPKGFADLD